MKVDLNPANYDPKKWAAIEKLKHLQIVEGLKMNVETLDVNSKGLIFLESDNPLHRDWVELENPLK